MRSATEPPALIASARSDSWPNLPHSSRAERRQDLVEAETSADLEGHRCADSMPPRPVARRLQGLDVFVGFGVLVGLGQPFARSTECTTAAAIPTCPETFLEKVRDLNRRLAAQIEVSYG
jgi:hypothetical protein